MKRILVCLLLCAALCTAAAGTAAQAPGALLDGTYFGAGAGRNGPITVCLVVQNGRVTEAQADGPQETPAIFGRAMQLLQQMVGLDSQTDLEALDTISGATYSSKGILEGASKAMAQATPPMPWLHAADGDCPGAAFVDLPAYGSWAHQAIDWAVSIGVTNGVDATHFAPAAVCTRAQVVSFLWRAAGRPEPRAETCAFVDVTDGYYRKAVLWAVENGITNGADAQHFLPDAPCTRGQIVTFLWRAAGMPQADTTESVFSDVQSGYYFSAVLWAVQAGVTNGVDPAHFAPGAPCSRAQVVTFCFRGISYINLK